MPIIARATDLDSKRATPRSFDSCDWFACDQWIVAQLTNIPKMGGATWPGAVENRPAGASDTPTKQWWSQFVYTLPVDSYAIQGPVWVVERKSTWSPSDQVDRVFWALRGSDQSGSKCAGK